MKRIKAACITQTIHFINKDAYGSDYSKRKVQEDGSVIMEIVREYGNNKPTGHYLE